MLISAISRLLESGPRHRTWQASGPRRRTDWRPLNLKPHRNNFRTCAKGAAEIIREDELKAKFEKSHRHRQAAAREAGRRSHRAGHSPGPHRGAAQAETFSGPGPHGDFSGRRFHRHGRRPHRPIRNAAAADARASGRQRARPISSRSTKFWTEDKTEVRYNSEWLGKHEQPRHCAAVRALSPGAHAGARGFSLAPREESADLRARAALSAAPGLRFGGAPSPMWSWAPPSRNSICWWAAISSASTGSRRRWR